MEPQVARRAALVALQSLAPYCLARWAPALRSQDEDSDDGGWRQENFRDFPAAAASHDHSRLPLLPHQRLWQQACCSRLTFCVMPALMQLPTGSVQFIGMHTCQSLGNKSLQVKRQGTAAWQWLGQYSGEATRLHLALFYIYGSYYEWPKRLTGRRIPDSLQTLRPW